MSGDRVSVLQYPTLTQSPKKLPVAINLLSPNLATWPYSEPPYSSSFRHDPFPWNCLQIVPFVSPGSWDFLKGTLQNLTWSYTLRESLKTTGWRHKYLCHWRLWTCTVWGVSCEVWGLRFKVWGVRCEVWGVRCEVWGAHNCSTEVLCREGCDAVSLDE